jgi:UDPglucose 6-dehydrogenase
VLVLTDWQEFAELDLKKLHSVMKYPLLLDGRNLFPPEKMRGYGFTYFSVGRPPVLPEPADALAVAV